MSDHDVLFAISSSSASSNSTAATAAPTTTTSASSHSKSHHHKHHHHHHYHKSHGKNMAPTPDNDQASNGAASNPNKAPPDKPAKGNRGEAPKDEKVSVPRTVDDLNDGELRALLDEAANYKNPKDREGKSKLFNHLLLEAEETERNARASRAGGSELVRYHNPSAARRGTRHRNKKRSSVSENMMHGGSLDNLAKETLYETSKSRGGKKSVSARQREGGSLPCNVNAPNAIKVECVEFLEEEARRRKIRNEPTQPAAAAVAAAMPPVKSEYYNSYRSGASYVLNMEPECFTFLNHDKQDKQQQLLMNSINQHQQHQFSSTTMPIEIVHYPVAQHAKFTSMASLHVILPVSPDGGGGGGSGGTRNNVDDAIQLGPLELYAPARAAKNSHLPGLVSTSSSNNNNSTTLEEIDEHKKVDENDNEKGKEGEEGEDGQDKDADKAKEEADKKKEKDKEKKKKTGERNVTVCTSQELKGFNRKIANSSVQSILEYLGEPKASEKDLRLNHPFKSSKLRNCCEDNKKGKKRNKDHTNSSAGDKLKKSNSMSEISSTAFDDDEDVGVSRNKSVDRRERRSWGEMESPLPSLHLKQQQQQQQQNMSAENLETGFQEVVTKKKKGRKRRCSLGTSGIDSSAPHSASGSGPSHGHHQRNFSGRKSSEDGRTYSQSGSSYATSSVSESGSGLKSGKPTAARSAPQSDKSDSCSDADSVHSLPISAVAPSAHGTEKAAAVAGTAVAATAPEAATKAKVISYAEMARNGDASCRTKQHRTSFGTKITTNYGIVDSNANNSVYNLNNINNNSNNNSSKAQPKVVERRKSPEPPCNQREDEEDKQIKIDKQQQQQKQQQEEKQEPPDVTSIESFPAIKSPLEKNHGQSSSVSNFSSSSSSSNNISNSSSGGKGKTQKIDASTNTGRTNAWNNNRGIASIVSNTPNSGGGTPRGGLPGFENVSGSYAMYNKMPKDIPDVKTIEKMQLLSQGHPYEESDSITSTANNTPIPSITSNATGSSSSTSTTGSAIVVVTSTPKTTANNDCSLDCDTSEKRTLKNNNNNNNHNNNINKVGITAVVGGGGGSSIDASSSVIDDSGSALHHEDDRNSYINESGLEAYEFEEEDEGGEEEISEDVAAAAAAAAAAEEEEETQRRRQLEQQRPPVVILSGAAEPKDVSGLVFGFDINEQLLNEGRSVTVDEFTSKFVMPTNNYISQNHAEMVKYVSDAYKDFYASGNVVVYSPDMDKL